LTYIYDKIKTNGMAGSKKGLFSEELVERANLFKALAHPARLQILEFLVQSKTCITGDISEHFPLCRTTVNQHLKELKDAGLICGHVEGAKIVYCLDIEKVNEMEKILAGLLNDIHLPKDFCCSLYP
jgi:ArsR family transcriptional regulator